MHVVRFVVDLVLWLFFVFVAVSASFYNTILLIFFFEACCDRDAPLFFCGSTISELKTSDVNLFGKNNTAFGRNIPWAGYTTAISHKNGLFPTFWG